MSLDSPVGAGGLEAQRALIKRARRTSWQWYFRAVLMTIVSALAVARHWLIFGVAFGAMAIMAIQLGRVTRRRAADLAARMKQLHAS